MYLEGLKCYKELKRKCKYFVMFVRDKELDVMWKVVIVDRY